MSKISEQDLLAFEENVQIYRRRDQLNIDECRDVTIKILESISTADKIADTKQKYPTLETYYEEKLIKGPGISIGGSLAKVEYDTAEEKYKKSKKIFIGVSIFVLALVLLYIVYNIKVIEYLVVEVIFVFVFLFVPLELPAICYFLVALVKRRKARTAYNQQKLEEERINREKREEYEKKLPIEKRKLAKQYELSTDGYEYAEKILTIATENSIISNAYFGYTEKLIEYLKNGRADTMKEAINLLENEKQQQKLYNLQMKHNSQMEYEARKQARALQAQAEAAQMQADVAREQARVQQSELRAQTEEARRQSQAAQRLSDSQRGSSAQCSNCLNRNGCTLKGNPPRNCGAFRSRY